MAELPELPPVPSSPPNEYRGCWVPVIPPARCSIAAGLIDPPSAESFGLVGGSVGDSLEGLRPTLAQP